MPLGLSACTAPSHALPCSAAVIPPRPVQNASETITIRSVAGAVALTKAAYKTTSTFGLTATNSLGVGRVVYRIGRATLGFSVKVTVLVVKGHRAGVCVASFTPTRAVAVPKPKPVPKPIPQPVPHPVPPPRPAGLKATISPVWIGHSIGTRCQLHLPGLVRSPIRDTAVSAARYESTLLSLASAHTGEFQPSAPRRLLR